MTKAFKDYYEPFKGEAEGIDPSLSREDNYDRFKRASSRYSQMHGKDVELAMVRAALGIFGDETKYQEYRQNYVSNKLAGFIEGAVENNSLIRSKYNNLIKNAKQNGISETEVKALLESLNIKIINNPRSSKKAEGEKVEDKTKNQGNTTSQGGSSGQENTTKQDGSSGQGKTTSQGDTKDKSDKPRKNLWKAGIPLGLVAIFLVGMVLFKYTPIFKKQSQPQANEKKSSDVNTIDLALAISFLNINPPEYSKIEEAVKAFKANINEPGAKEGLIKATDIYLKWGEDSPSLNESRSMYQKALDCCTAANDDRIDEIKNKLKELVQ